MNFRDTMKINDKGVLEIGGCDCVKLVERYGSPLFVMDEQYIRDVCRAYKKTIESTYGNGNMAYASKAFCCKAIYEIMQEEGVCIDVVSGGEIYTAVKAGFDLNNAYFHGNNKLQTELKLAIDNGIGTIVVDNVDEADVIDRLARENNTIQKVLIRINPGVEAHTHSFIQTAKVDSKFGFSIKNSDALDVIKLLKSKKNIRFAGLHCHIGSQIFDKKAFALAVDVVTDYVAQLASEEGIEVDELNFGGGFGVHYAEGDPKYNVEEYCDYVKLLTLTLKDCVERKGIKMPKFMIEPGRSIVGEAGITLYTIGAIKDIKGIRKYVAIDGGMTDNIRCALYDAKYEAILAGRANEKCNDVVTVAGKCCESGDIIIKDLALPKAKRGDILAVFTTGAYCYAMSSNYNRNLTPAVVFVKDGKSAVAVKAQTYEDIVRADVSLDYDN
ncbi:MAG: diaminopimelate decarboxylase [Clostridia bacterium]|nr:diaminopimelate decarboxylase [Clostridia bacterium]